MDAILSFSLPVHESASNAGSSPLAASQTASTTDFGDPATLSLMKFVKVLPHVGTREHF
jgi:hypothetical protein